MVSLDRGKTINAVLNLRTFGSGGNYDWDTGGRFVPDG